MIKKLRNYKYLSYYPIKTLPHMVSKNEGDLIKLIEEMDKKLDKEAKGMLKVVEELEKDGIEEKYKEKLEKKKKPKSPPKPDDTEKKADSKNIVVIDEKFFLYLHHFFDGNIRGNPKTYITLSKLKSITTTNRDEARYLIRAKTLFNNAIKDKENIKIYKYPDLTKTEIDEKMKELFKNLNQKDK